MAWVKEEYGGEWELVAAPAGGGQPGPPAPEFAEGDDLVDQDDPGKLPDEYAAQLDQAAGTAMDGLIEPVRKLVMEAKSLEDLRDRLLDAYGEMDVSELGALMQQALAAAELAGRYAVARADAD